MPIVVPCNVGLAAGPICAQHDSILRVGRPEYELRVASPIPQHVVKICEIVEHEVHMKCTWSEHEVNMKWTWSEHEVNMKHITNFKHELTWSWTVFQGCSWSLHFICWTVESGHSDTTGPRRVDMSRALRQETSRLLLFEATVDLKPFDATVVFAMIKRCSNIRMIQYDTAYHQCNNCLPLNHALCPVWHISLILFATDFCCFRLCWTPVWHSGSSAKQSRRCRRTDNDLHHQKQFLFTDIYSILQSSKIKDRCLVDKRNLWD